MPPRRRHFARYAATAAPVSSSTTSVLVGAPAVAPAAAASSRRVPAPVPREYIGAVGGRGRRLASGDRNRSNAGESVAHPDESPAEVVETAQILAEDPTGDLRDCTADGAAPAPGPEAA